jgi:hypothetical protein
MNDIKADSQPPSYSSTLADVSWIQHKFCFHVSINFVHVLIKKCSFPVTESEIWSLKDNEANLQSSLFSTPLTHVSGTPNVWLAAGVS